jgi:hypothetical protein
MSHACHSAAAPADRGLFEAGCVVRSNVSNPQNPNWAGLKVGRQY